MKNTPSFRFCAPLESTLPTLDELLRRAFPEATKGQRKALLERGQVEVDGRVWRDVKRQVADGAIVTLPMVHGEEAYGLPEAMELARGEDWLLVDKPIGMPGELNRDNPMNPILFLADLLGLERDTFTPCWEMPIHVGGPWLFGLTQESASVLEQGWRSGEMMMTFLALTRRLELPSGQLLGPGDVPITYTVTRYLDGLCEVQLIPEYGRKAQHEDAPHPMELLMEAMGDANAPILGDRMRGGHMVEGGVRLRLESILWETHGIGHSWSAPSDWVPRSPVIAYTKPEKQREVLASDEDTRNAYAPLDDFDEDTLRPQRTTSSGSQSNLDHPTMRVSDKTLEIMQERGHPWVLEDNQTGGRAHMKPGTLVRLVGKKGTHTLKLHNITSWPHHCKRLLMVSCCLMRYNLCHPFSSLRRAHLPLPRMALPVQNSDHRTATNFPP